MRTYLQPNEPARVVAMQAPHVLVGYDGSLGADAALCALAHLPWPAGTRLRILGVRETHLRFRRSLASAPLNAEFEDVVTRAARRLRVELGQTVVIEEHVVSGTAALAIVADASSFAADLIVVGTRNQSSLRSTFLGSVSREVVDRAGLPVLVAQGQRMDRVLLAHDGSAAARAAVQMVSSWPIFAGSSVRMFSVADTSGGDAAVQILTAAALNDANLVVVGAHSAHGLERVLHGDVAGDLLPRLRRSLLVVPGAERDQLQPATSAVRATQN
jgi:nucleotide-binding universal stress UspA family protein